jgi:hypothetical protein
MTRTPIALADLFRYYRAMPHQMAAIQMLGERIPASILSREMDWFKVWSQAGCIKDEELQKQQDGVRLPVPYEYQNDNASGEGWRECMSSSCAMLARFHGKIKNDDAYNAVRRRYGDTTIQAAHVQALTSLGLNARFVTNGTVKMLEAELLAGRPVAVGWLHHGPVAHPSGGGHWSVVTGYTAAAFIHNDPNGEADLINGGYRNHSAGKGIAYSRKNWLRRWLPDGPSCGWAILVS